MKSNNGLYCAIILELSPIIKALTLLGYCKKTSLINYFKNLHPKFTYVEEPLYEHTNYTTTHKKFIMMYAHA